MACLLLQTLVHYNLYFLRTTYSNVLNHSLCRVGFGLFFVLLFRLQSNMLATITDCSLSLIFLHIFTWMSSQTMTSALMNSKVVKPCQLLSAVALVLTLLHWVRICRPFICWMFYNLTVFSYIDGYQKALWTQCSGGLWIISCSSVAACQCDVLCTFKMCMKCNGCVITVTYIALKKKYACHLPLCA